MCVWTIVWCVCVWVPSSITYAQPSNAKSRKSIPKSFSMTSKRKTNFSIYSSELMMIVEFMLRLSNLKSFEFHAHWLRCRRNGRAGGGGDTNRSKWRKRIEWHARYVCLKKFEILNYKISTFVSLHWVWWCWWCWRWWWTLINWI